MYGVVLGDDPKDLAKTLADIGVFLTKEELRMDVRPLLKIAFSRFFRNNSGFVDMVSQHIPSPAHAAKRKIETAFSGPLNSKLAEPCSSATLTVRL